MIFRAEIQAEAPRETVAPPAMLRMEDQEVGVAALEMTGDATSAVSPIVTVGKPDGYLGDVDWKSVWRNDR